MDRSIRLDVVGIDLTWRGGVVVVVVVAGTKTLSNEKVDRTKKTEEHLKAKNTFFWGGARKERNKVDR